MRKSLVSMAAVATAMMAPSMASAEIITYDVQNIAGGVHGLWTNSSFGTGTANSHWSWQPGTTLVLDTDAGTATLSGTVINGAGESSVIDLSFGGFQDALDLSVNTYKAGGGAYDPSVQDFYTTASGSFDFASFGTYDLDANDPFAGNTVFQFGEGANDKNGLLGFSAWLLPSGFGDAAHWDINANLVLRPTDVPEPAPIALLALGLGGLAFSRARRRKRATATA